MKKLLLLGAGLCACVHLHAQFGFSLGYDRVIPTATHDPSLTGVGNFQFGMDYKAQNKPLIGFVNTTIVPTAYGQKQKKLFHPSSTASNSMAEVEFTNTFFTTEFGLRYGIFESQSMTLYATASLRYNMLNSSYNIHDPALDEDCLISAGDIFWDHTLAFGGGLNAEFPMGSVVSGGEITPCVFLNIGVGYHQGGNIQYLNSEHNDDHFLYRTDAGKPGSYQLTTDPENIPGIYGCLLKTASFKISLVYRLVQCDNCQPPDWLDDDDDDDDCDFGSDGGGC